MLPLSLMFWLFGFGELSVMDPWTGWLAQMRWSVRGGCDSPTSCGQEALLIS